MYSKLKDFLLKKESLLFCYGLVAIIAAVQAYYGGVKRMEGLPNDFTHYNNYLIFKQSFFHLLEGKDLYVLYLNEHWDLFKYSPTFALIFGIFAWMPDGMGLVFWNVANAISLWQGIRMLPKLDLEKRNLILLFSLVELFTSLQNSQSNALIAGLVVMAFALMEKEKFFLGCLLIAITVYIKLFGVFGFVLCLLYPQRLKMAAYSMLSGIVLGLLPLAVIKFSQLSAAYESWWHLLQSDYIPNNLSLTGVIKIWSGLQVNPSLVLLIGVVMLLIPLLRYKYFTHYHFRLSMLAMILLWMIVFNHKAESPTFIIAIAGVGVWYFSKENHQRWQTVLVWLAFVFTSLSPTDVFPNYIQDHFFDPWSVKAIPCILIYFMLFYQLTFRPNQFIQP